MLELDWVGGELYIDVFCEKVCVCFYGLIIGVGVYIVEKVEMLIGKGLIDVVVFGCDWIVNLDLVVCLQCKVEFNLQCVESFYGGGVEGYIDYLML